MGMCGTDLELIRGDYGWAPPGRERLIIRGDLVVSPHPTPQAGGRRP
jgi:hypothetical protein